MEDTEKKVNTEQKVVKNKKIEEVAEQPKFALITGANGGLANAAIKELTELNYTIFALDIDKDVARTYKENTKVVPIICDVTDAQAVTDAFKQVSEQTKKLDLIANFAGIVTLGSLIERPSKQLEQIFAVNVVGMYRINKAAFKYVKNAEGRIINICSEYSIFDAVPFNVFYGISKHSVELYSDGLRRELAPFNIPVIKIRPGAFRTPMQRDIRKQFNEVVEASNLYKDIYANMKTMMEKEIDRAKNPEIFAKVFIKAATAPKPKLAYNTNISKQMKLLSSLPACLQDKVYKSYFK